MARHPPGMALLLAAACLLVSPASGQWQSGPVRQPTSSPTWSPTLPPTPHPITLNCNLTAYAQRYAETNESCYACRNNYQCAWCVPDSGAAGFCYSNVNNYCPGRSGSYSDTICQPPVQVSGVVVAIVVTVLLLLCCCCGACCFYGFKARRNRNLLQQPGAGGGFVTAQAGGITIMAPTPPIHQSYPPQPPPRPYSPAAPGYPGGGAYYAAPPAPPMQTPYTQQGNYSYNPAYPPPMSTAPPPPPSGYVSPPPPQNPHYGKYDLA